MFEDMRQPPLVHTRSFHSNYDLLASYPEDGENLPVRTNAEGAPEIVLVPNMLPLPPASYANVPPLARHDHILVFSTTVTNTWVSGYGVLANDRDAEHDLLTATLVSGPMQGTLSLTASGFFTYTPTTGTLINDSFTYRASDGLHDSNVVRVTISAGRERTFLPVVQRGD
jgi:Bacterial Ig domain